MANLGEKYVPDKNYAVSYDDERALSPERDWTLEEERKAKRK